MHHLDLVHAEGSTTGKDKQHRRDDSTAARHQQCRDLHMRCLDMQPLALMVVSSEPEKTRSGEAARARTAPEWPVSVARHCSVATSHTLTCVNGAMCFFCGG